MSTRTIHGKIIELAEELGVPEGQDVEITVRLVSSNKPTRTGEGSLVTEGALADDPYWDVIMAQMRQERRGGEQ